MTNFFNIKLNFTLLLSTLLMCQISFSQKITLPYQEIEGVPVVSVTIDGKSHDFVFDTGSYKTFISSSLAKNMEIVDSSLVQGVYGKQSWLTTVQLNNLMIDETKFGPLEADVNNNFKIFRKYFCNNQLDGVLGFDIMEGYIVEIDPRHQVIKFYNRKTFDKKKLNDFAKSNYWYGPLAKIKVNGNKHYAIFDTGSSNVLNIAAKGEEKLVEYVKNHSHITSYSSGGIGFFGKNSQKAKSYKIDTIKIKLVEGWFKKTPLLSSPVSINSESNSNNMGFQYIKQFHVFLDQKKHKLYLKHYTGNDREKYIDPLFVYGFDIDFDFDSENFYVNARTESSSLKIGDIVLKINGHSLPQEKCAIGTFKENYFNAEMEITILRDNKEKVITYQIPENLKEV